MSLVPGAKLMLFDALVGLHSENERSILFMLVFHSSSPIASLLGRLSSSLKACHIEHTDPLRESSTVPLCNSVLRGHSQKKQKSLQRHHSPDWANHFRFPLMFCAGTYAKAIVCMRQISDLRRDGRLGRFSAKVGGVSAGASTGATSTAEMSESNEY